MSRSRVTFIAWAPTAGRACDLAADLSGEARTIYPTRLSARRLTPLRYTASAVATVAYLVHRRPKATVVQNPPVYPALICLAYARLTRGRFILDNHPASFGAKDNVQARRMLAVTRYLVRHADAVLVTTEGWSQVVRNWGGRALVLHEAPPLWSVTPSKPLAGRRPRVLFSCVFASDEPIAAVIDAARVLPGFDVRITGDQRKAPPGALDDLPSNVSTTGWLDQQAYAAEVDACDILLALTTEPSSVMRAAYEAGYAGRILVMSHTDAMCALFPEAVVTETDASSIASALRLAVASYDHLLDTLSTVRQRQQRRWAHQRTGLLDLLGINDSEQHPDFLRDNHVPPDLPAEHQVATSSQKAARP